MCFQRTAICSPLIAASKTRIPFLSTWFCECLVASTPLYGTEISPTAKRHAKCFSLSGKVCIDVCSALIVNLAENAANNNRSHSCWLIDWAVTAKFISYLLGGQEKVKAGMGGGGAEKAWMKWGGKTARKEEGATKWEKREQALAFPVPSDAQFITMENSIWIVWIELRFTRLIETGESLSAAAFRDLSPLRVISFSSNIFSSHLEMLHSRYGTFQSVPLIVITRLLQKRRLFILLYLTNEWMCQKSRHCLRLFVVLNWQTISIKCQ